MNVFLGVQIYSFHSVLHYWTDKMPQDPAKSFPQLTKGYSKVLVNEMVIPGAPWLTMAAVVDDDSIAVFSRTNRVSLEGTIALCWAQSRQDLEGSFRCTQLD